MIEAHVKLSGLRPMLPLDEARLKLKDVRQAIDLEKKHHYTDIQGRKKRFSDFLWETLQELSPFFEGESEVAALLKTVRQYPFLDVGSRIRILDTLVFRIDSLSLTRAAKPRAKTVVATGTTSKTPAQTDVKFVKGVGPRIATLLLKAEIKTAEDLLYTFPRKYLDYNNRLKIKALEEGQEATILGTIQGVYVHQAKNRNLVIATLTVKDDTGYMVASWMFSTKHPGMLDSWRGRFTKGAEVMLSGKVKWDSYKNKMGMDRPEVEILSYEDAEAGGAESLNAGRIIPVYPLVHGLNLKLLRRAIRNALDQFLPVIEDPLPTAIREEHQLVDLQTALEQVHFPETFYHYEAARKRLVFDELFYLQLRLAMIRSQYKHHNQGLCLPTHTGGLTETAQSLLPYQLTGAQARVLGEIREDMTGGEPMYRLLQGDVGSGKTVVALLTLMMAVENGYQGVLMAPTEILAEQHYRNFVQWLTPLGLKAGLFTGKAGVKERRALKQDLVNGQIHIAVGTHALIQDGIDFHKLGVIVVDEQHRFGVRQRMRLKGKGDNPHLLTMTATPIPRTLAMTLHGDLDVSILDELPPGRSPIETHLFLGKAKRKEAYGIIAQEIVRGRQAYVVYPLIEESETMTAKAATVEYERLSKEVFPHLRLGLLHGKLSSEDKDAVMGEFKAGRLDILVSTTVIEVGVDVPNSTVMVIENADRFGLAQLHQLRGRVGRGAHQSYCMLLTDSKTPETLTRLGIMVESTDGFYIAEQDLAIRGPGELLGTRQSGLPDLVLADLLQDQQILEMARTSASQLVDADPGLAHHRALYDTLFAKTEDTFGIMSAG